MGVPKFYRWLSERYPCLSQVIKEHQIPEFDNLYLDMNGIIHPCSHPNDDDPHFRITETEIFKNIFNYIEVLFRIIKPKKNFFMAVDGCAPRAKMNQQRSRRFRTAKDAEDNIRKALLKGQTLPKEDRFDSNCITPGTDFMARLQQQLKYFVNHKISTDSMWQNCNVYLSGHDVPGEGEHKVMDFIRYHKSQPGYDPNTRHCLYGLDADLIMLGLTTHEPHFSLLREEVQFGKQAKRMIRPEQQTFHLLHLSLMREYIDMEFSSIKPLIHFQYDLERIIDDWILLGFMVGNDFVPHLPHLHINHDALPYLYQVYKDFMPSTDGYMNDGGTINLNRMKKYFEFLSKFDRDHFEELYADLKWLESKGTGKLLKEREGPTKINQKKFSELLKSLDDSDFPPTPVKSKNPYEALANVSGAFEDFSFNETPQKPTHSTEKLEESEKLKEGAEEDDVEVEDEETFELEFKQHKRQYYMEKFDMDIVDDDQIQTICYEYVRALQWICHYYFNGLQSWSWYYPYHYSPFISDIANFDIKELRFDMGQPFHPFEQLLAVLPAASRKLLPEAFQNLMIMDTSAIIDFYPPDFRTDLNGKQQEWEAVVLIPFIDETRLLKAMLVNYSGLTDEEKERNAFGKCFEYSYDKNLNFVYHSSNTGVFEDITTCRAKSVDRDREFFHLSIHQLKKGLLKGTKLDVYFHGFPTMKHLKHVSVLKKAGVRVFQQNSRNMNTIVKINNDGKPVLNELAQQLIGESVYVEWPYMVEGLVSSVCDESVRYYFDEKNQLTPKLIQGEEYKLVKREMKSIESTHLSRKGIELGTVKIMVEVKLLLGKRYVCGQKGVVKLTKEWSPNSTFYAYQATVKDLAVHDSEQDAIQSLETLYPAGSMCFMMASPHYGSSGEVIECQPEAGRVRVALKVIPEPNFELVMQQYDSLAVHYISDRAVAQRLGIAPQLLGRITGDVLVYMSPDNKSSVNIGLKLKYSGQNKEVLGYARRAASGWTFSPATINVLKEYMNEFPEVFEAIGKTKNHENYYFGDLWPRKHKSFLDNIKDFLKKLPCSNSNPVRCGGNSLDEPVVQAIEGTVDVSKASSGERKIVKVKVKPHLLFKAIDQFGKLSPDPSTKFLLFDRVVSVQTGSIVPVGLRGTVIGIHEVLTDETNKESPTETKYEVLFDEEFLGGMKLRSQGKRCYFVSSNSLINISYGERKEKEKKGIPLKCTDFQNKISQPMTTKATSSPYTQRTPGIIHTPPHVFQDFKKRNTPTYSGNKDSSSPQWLKGNYQSPNSYSSPQQQHSQPRRNQQQKRYNNPPQPQMSDNNDFMSMWQELEKAKLQETPPSNNDKGVDKNATVALHQMLHLDNTSQSAPPGYQPHTPVNYQQQQHKQQAGFSNQPPQNYTPKGAGIKTNQQYEQGSMDLLRQYCSQTSLPPPKLAYTNSQQGVSAMIMIGHTGKYCGNACVNQQLACDSAAALALQHIKMNGASPAAANTPVQYAYSIPTSPYQNIAVAPYSPVYMNKQPRYPQQQQQQQQQRLLYQSPRYFSPQQQQNQQHQQRYQSPRGPRQQSNSDTNLSGGQPMKNKDIQKSKSDGNVSQSINPFIPHQVLVKNKSAQEVNTVSPAFDQSNNADNELKGMLGIKVKGRDEELKDLLGIGRGSPSQMNPEVNPQQYSSMTQKQQPDRDLYLKNILGVPTGQTDDMRLKSLLGIPMQTTNTTLANTSNTVEEDNENVVNNTDQNNTIATNPDALSSILSTFNISSNINQQSTTVLQQSSQSTPPLTPQPTSASPVPNMALTPTKNGTSNSTDEVNAKPKKQILLAPSFFGPKKK